MARLVWAVILAAAFSVAAAAQATVAVTGTVVAAGEKKAPVVGAVVESGSARAVTDAAGRFKLTLPQARATIVASAKGFLTARLSVDIDVAFDSARPLEIVLAPNPDFREDVTVTSTPLDETPAAAARPLEPKAVERVAGAADNVFKVLQTLPGVSATDDFGSRLSVRGGGPDQNLTLMDGVEIHNPYRLFGLSSAFNPETVDHFELTAGGFGAKYGDRLSSILLVDNRAGSTSKTLAGSANVSLTDANLVFEGKLPGGASGSWLLTGRRTYYDLIADRITKTNLPAFDDLQAKAVWEPRPGHRLTFFALRSREKTDATFDSSGSASFVSLGDASRNDMAALTYSAVLGQRASSRTVLAWYDYRDALGVDASVRDGAARSNAPGDEAFSQAAITFTRDLGVKDVSLRQELGVQAGRRHFLETGFELHLLQTTYGWAIAGSRNETVANGSSILGGAGLPSLLASTIRAPRVGVYVQDRFQIARAFRLEPGLRVDHSGAATDTPISPRIAASLDLTRSTRLRAAAGLYTQSPGYEKALQSDYFVDLTSPEASSLKYERSTHVVGALEHSFTAAITGRVEAYYKTFSGLIVGRLETPQETAARVAQYAFPPNLASSVPTAPLITSAPVNGAGGRAYGFDVYVEKQPATSHDRLSGWASYTWGRATVDSYGEHYPFDYDRRHSGSVVGTIGLWPRIDLSATARVATGFPSTPAVGLRVASVLAPGAIQGAPGSLVPAVDAGGRPIWTVDLGGVSNLNSGRLPLYARVDVRFTIKSGAGDRWQVYVEVLNVFNRRNVSTLQPRLEFDPTSDRPRITYASDSGLPRLPSFGFRYRF